MRRSALAVLFCTACYFLLPVPTRGVADELQRGFAKPPLSARPGAFWPWLNGNVDRKRVTYELEQMKAKGMGGADIWDVRAAINPGGMIPSGPAFLSDESLKAIGHAVREAKRLGLRLGMIAASGWNAGGPWVKPRDAGMGLFVASTTLEGPLHATPLLPFPAVPQLCPKNAAGIPVYWHDVRVLAFPETPDRVIPARDAVLDLSEHLDKQGRLTWDVPRGKWTVLRFVSTNTGHQLIVPSPNSGGPMIDFLNPDATRMHFQHIVDRLRSELGDISKSSLKYLEVDSMELGDDTPWTERMIDRFTQQHGYDPTPYLPVLKGWTITDPDITRRFLYDWRLTLSDLFIDSHYRAGSRLLHQYGLQLCAEAGGPGAPIWPSCPVESLKALGSVDILRGEFWPKHRNMRLVKEISSAAHIYGKQIVDAESFTSWRHWQDGPYFDKQLADNAFGAGLNHLTFHTFSHSPWSAGLPGWEYHAGTHINPNCVWWPMSGPFIEYLSRCSYLLQQGRFVADACFYYGSEAPNFVPPKGMKFSPGPGYDYDVVNRDVILHRVQVRDGRLTLPDGMNYAVLILPDREAIDLEVLRKLESLIRNGATVIGTRSTRTQTLADYPNRDRLVATLATKIWGEDGRERPYGQGRVIPSRDIAAVLRGMQIPPDFTYSGTDPRARLDYIHRRTESADIYFVVNRNERWEDVTCSFRIGGKQPELWHPETGEICTAVPFRERNSRTMVPLHLGPAESLFVVFRKAAPPVHFVGIETGHAEARKSRAVLLPHSATPAGPMWLSDGKGAIANQSITFDLGHTCDLTKFRVWNYNENVLGHINYGVKDMDVLVANGDGPYRKVLSCVLDAGSENEDRDYAQDVALAAKDVRFVRFDVKSNHNRPNYSDGVGKFVGLSKIIFFANQPIDGVTIESVSSGSAFAPRSDNFLGEVHVDAELRLAASGTTFLRAWRPGTVTLVDSLGQRHPVNVADVPEPVAIRGAWQVHFTSGWGAPAATTFVQLHSWTESDVAEIRYYSGIARYKKQIHLPDNLLASDLHIELDLGIVQKVARVTLNGHPVGVLWKPPYRVAVSKFLRPGTNELEVEIANTWTNRLIGDAHLPADKRFCKTNLRERVVRRESKLQPSGLLGPVQLDIARDRCAVPLATAAPGR